MDNKIPWGITHKSTLNKPHQQKQPDKEPTEQQLRMLIASDCIDAARELIERYDLKYTIENGELKDLLKGTDLWLRKFITHDEETLAMLDDVRRLAKTDDEVLITGETGTGKETIARAMIGSRDAQVLAINCAGLPDNLIESELFGHVRGAFTGAESQKTGLMTAAKNGVLFLDEIGELPLHVQAKLLRALQEKQIRKVGSNVVEEINCKFVCATHRNIKQMVKEDKFRQDLYARISTFELHIKPLRHRECDIVPIIESLPGGKDFLKAINEQGIHISKFDLSLNVRSLIQHVRRYAVLGRLIIS